MRNGIVSAVIPLTFPIVCFGQTKIPIRNTSAHRSPVRVVGAVTLTKNASNIIWYTYRVEGTLLNRSRKGVVLTVIHFEAGGVSAPQLDNLDSTDCFFGPATLLPKHSVAADSVPIQFGQPTVNGKPVPEDVGPNAVPWATAKVDFAQFLDGSTWGHADAAQQALASRRKTLQELGLLEPILDRADKHELMDRLAEDIAKNDTGPYLLGIPYLMSVCKDKAESCLVDGLRSMIQAARQHEAEMKRDLDPSL
jgi:hypothetical protein